MEIVLMQYVESLGESGKIVNVSAGYARNFLFPRKLAVSATPANLKLAAALTERESVKVDRIKTDLQKKADKLTNVSVTASVTVGEEDKVFGSVTTHDIVALLAEQGLEFERKDITLHEPLKALGQYDVEIKFGYGISGTIQVWVVRSED